MVFNGPEGHACTVLDIETQLRQCSYLQAKSKDQITPRRARHHEAFPAVSSHVHFPI